MNTPHPTSTNLNSDIRNNSNTAFPQDSTVNLIELIYRVVDNIIWIIIAAVVGALLMGKVAGTTSSVSYYSIAKLYLVNPSDPMLTMSSLQSADSLVNDYLAMFQTKELHNIVAEKTNNIYSANQLSGMVSASNLTDTHIISITVRTATPEDSVLLADTYAQILSKLVTEKFNIPSPQIFEEATPAVKNVTSNTKQNYIIGAMIGLFLSCITVVLHGIFDDRICTPEDLQRAVGVETLGIITKQKKCHSARRRSK